MTDAADAGSVVQPEAASAGNPAQPTPPVDNGSATEGAKGWFDGLSEGNRKLAETKGWNTPESLDKVFTSYAELERQQGDALRVPATDAPAEEWDKFYSKLPETMRPVESAEKLEFKRPDNLPENMPYADELANTSKAWMHEAKLSPAQAQTMHDKFVGYMAEQAQAQQDALVKSVEETHDALVKEWGPVESEGFKQKLEVANRAMKKLGLSEAYTKKGILLADGSLTDPQIAVAFQTIGEAMFAEDTIGADGVPHGANPFKKNANGERNMTAISQLVRSDPERARRLAREAGENPDQWITQNPL